jgi:hypothetical protein
MKLEKPRGVNKYLLHLWEIYRITEELTGFRWDQLKN